MDRRRPRSIRSRPLVLVVDDHGDTRELYVQGLVAFGFEAIAAADSEQAYRCAWDFHPDIIVTDLSLRGGDGWQLPRSSNREVRELERFRSSCLPATTNHRCVNAPSMRAVRASS